VETKTSNEGVIMRAKEFIIELKKESKPRNFVAKNAKMGGAGQHKDKKKAEKQGDFKHKKNSMPMESALRDKEDLRAKRKALDDLSRNKDVDQKAVQQRRLDLDKEAKQKGVEEGWKDKVAAAGLAGAMAFGAAGANARVMPGDDPNINRLTGKPIAAQQATDNAPTKAEAPKGFSKEYLQAVVDGKHPRPMVSVEKAKELLKNMSEGSLKELSTEKLAQYKKASGADAKKADADGDYARGDKRFKGINRATNKQFDNDLKKQGVAEGTGNDFRVGQRVIYTTGRGEKFPSIVTAIDFDEDAVKIKSANNKPFPNSGGDIEIVVDPGWKFLTAEPRVDPDSIIAVSPSMRKTTERVRDPEDWDEGNTEPPNNFAVYINGKKWKVFQGRGQYADDQREQAHYQQLKDWAAKKSAATGKKWTVSITGEGPTA